MLRPLPPPSPTLEADDAAYFGRAPPTPPPPFVANLLPTVLQWLGPKGLEFGRYSIDYHYLRNCPGPGRPESHSWPGHSHRFAAPKIQANGLVVCNFAQRFPVARHFRRQFFLKKLQILFCICCYVFCWRNMQIISPKNPALRIYSKHSCPHGKTGGTVPAIQECLDPLSREQGFFSVGEGR